MQAPALRELVRRRSRPGEPRRDPGWTAGAMATASEALRLPGAGGWLLAGLLAATAYSAFSSGAIDAPEESRLQIGIAGLGAAAGIGLGARRMAVAATPLAWAAVALLAGFGLWSAVSAQWSVLPEQSWLAANRATAYAAVVALALVAAASTPRAPRAFAYGLLAVVGAVALYAIGGKLFPELSLLGVDLDHTGAFSRLREPIGYWNGLGLLLVLAAPVCVWVAADPERASPLRLTCLLGLSVLALTVALTYSRGAIVAFVVATAIMVAAGPQRLRRLGVAALGVAAAVPAIVIGVTSDDLTTDGIAASQRAGEGLLLAAVLAGSLLALAAAGWLAWRREGRSAWGPARSRRAWRGLGGLAVAGLVAGVVAMSVSDRGLTGTIGHEWEEFKKVKRTSATDPGRLLSRNGSNRWVWWGEGLGAFSDEPLKGWGAGSFPATHLLYRKDFLEVRQPHSVPLQFLAETGVVGGLLGGGALVLLAWAAVAGVRRAAGPERAARLALAAAGGAWMVHTLYDWDWDIPAVTLPALAALAVAAAPSPPRRPGERIPQGNGAAPRRPRPLLAAAIAVGAAVLAMSALLPAWADDRRTEALRTAETFDDPVRLERAASQAALAHRLNPLSPQPLFAAATVARTRGRFVEAFQLLAEAARLAPGDVAVWRRLLEFQLQVRETRLLEETVRGLVRADPLGGVTTAAASVLLLTPPSLSPSAAGASLPPVEVPTGR